MDFSESVKALADRAKKLKENLKTEEATKTSLVLPFIQTLGYDIFNPLEVVPEFVADIAGKKGEKVDYAIMQDDKPIIIIECKACGADLNDINRDQLHRYFLTLDSSIGLLTDGIRYLFFSRSDDGKNMDATPFMEFSLDDIDPNLIPELRKLCKGKFDLKTTLDTVNELKFNRHIKLILTQNLETPDDGFISYFMGSAGVRGTAKAKEQFAGYTKRAFTEFVAEQVDGRLKTALAATVKKGEEVQQQPVATAITEPDITDNEYQAFYLVKAILMGTVEPERVFLRSVIGKGRSNILLDDSIRKPLLRLNFNKPEKLSVGLINEDKTNNFATIEKIDDILQHTEAIRITANGYLHETKKHAKAKEVEHPTEE